jgi:hypothetical protein
MLTENNIIFLILKKREKTLLEKVISHTFEYFPSHVVNNQPSLVAFQY